MTVSKLLKKYKEIAKKSEYVSTQEVISDLHQAYLHQKLMRVPKDRR